MSWEDFDVNDMEVKFKETKSQPESTQLDYTAEYAVEEPPPEPTPSKPTISPNTPFIVLSRAKSPQPEKAEAKKADAPPPSEEMLEKSYQDKMKQYDEAKKRIFQD